MFHMEQKDTKLEIVNELLKNESHLRDIARKLGTNHTLILRKMNILSKENVVDFREEGRNKVYFLKKSIEAKKYAFMAEDHKIIGLLKKYSDLRGIIEKIQKNKEIRLAVLFGSYAKGIAKKDSDIDVYVNTKNSKIKQEIERIDTRLNVKIGEYDSSNLLIMEIAKNHIILKGTEEYYEKNRFFG